jgi:hypothetical protein
VAIRSLLTGDDPLGDRERERAADEAPRRHLDEARARWPVEHQSRLDEWRGQARLRLEAWRARQGRTSAVPSIADLAASLVAQVRERQQAEADEQHARIAKATRQTSEDDQGDPAN